ncbi:IclR family transcriptional regulator C-terminal domain-containing protein [Microbispora sp. GKU 823]|uniref:IclR family transcriptional regulator domain-containing protein n=1 Tax=Microbispora sp. GKU 823 TaxID=1652100 RepID=UPI0009A44FC9|nr:IclR family transcriptional regulator C-terminal domain-containing protein [Microbispora sp. GKU 823]OPG07557.1 IclR family transcriptional regulator [Microbispora sp. GKU 823]
MSRTSADKPEQGSRTEQRPPHFVQSLERGLAVIRAFDHTRRQLTLAEVAKITGLDRAAARRFLLTLVDLGYMMTDGRLYSLRPRILELGYAYLSSLSLPEVAQPHMERLVAEVHETCSLGVLDGEDVVFVARVPVKRLMTVPIMVGSRFPAYPTSMGRVLLAGQPDQWLNGYLASAHLEPITDRTVTDPARLRALVDEARDQGWAIVDQEIDDGSRSIAVPVHDGSGHVVAALNVSMLAGRGTAETMRDFLPAMRRAADQIEADLRPGSQHQEIGLIG